jgi:hypothetical protein
VGGHLAHLVAAMLLVSTDIASNSSVRAVRAVERIAEPIRRRARVITPREKTALVPLCHRSADEYGGPVNHRVLAIMLQHNVFGANLMADNWCCRVSWTAAPRY